MTKPKIYSCSFSSGKHILLNLSNIVEIELCKNIITFTYNCIDKIQWKVDSENEAREIFQQLKDLWMS